MRLIYLVLVLLLAGCNLSPPVQVVPDVNVTVVPPEVIFPEVVFPEARKVLFDNADHRSTLYTICGTKGQLISLGVKWDKIIMFNGRAIVYYKDRTTNSDANCLVIAEPLRPRT